MDFTNYAMAAFVVIGLVNGVQLALDRNWKSFSMFLVAVGSGLSFGALHWFGLPDAQVGLAVGISSSGVYKIAQKIGGDH